MKAAKPPQKPPAVPDLNSIDWRALADFARENAGGARGQFLWAANTFSATANHDAEAWLDENTLLRVGETDPEDKGIERVPFVAIYRFETRITQG